MFLPTPQSISLGGAGTLTIPSNTSITGTTTGNGATLTNLVTVTVGVANSSFPVFTVNSGTVNVSIAALIITNGNNTGGGGGISNSGSLTISNSTIMNSNGGGGAVLNNGTVALSNSTLSRNFAEIGSAIDNHGAATLTNCTLAGNSGRTYPAGGVIFNDGTLTVIGTTFSGNSTSYGGAILNGYSSALTMSNSILSGDTGGECSGSGCPANGSNGNIVGVSANLAPLGNYGGPTQTMIPLPGSVVICAINPSSAAGTDQRGLPRTTVYGSNTCQDAGAVQTNYSMAFVQQPSAVAQNISMSPAPSVQLDESGSSYLGGAVTIPLSLTGNGVLSGGSASTSTSNGVATYPSLSVSATGSGDTLTANLTLNGTTAIASAPSSSFDVSAQSSQTISFTLASPVTYGVAPITLSATATSGLPVSFSVLSGPGTISGNTLTVGGVGTIVVAANQAGNAAYLPATQVTQTLIVSQSPQTISFTLASPVTYGVVPIMLSATATSGLPVSFTVVSGPGAINGNTLTIVGAGTIVAAANQTGNANYLPAPQVTQALIVSQAALALTANNATRVYGTANPVFKGTVTGAQNGDTFTESFMTTATIASNAGTYSIVPSVTGANLTGYTQVINDGTLSITQAASTTALTVNSSSITPGQSLTLTAQVTSATSGTPTGTVSFYDGTSLLSTAPLSAGTASYSTPSLSAGTTHTLTAAYSGDTNFTAGSASAGTTVTVAPLAFTLTLPGPTTLTVAPGGSVSSPFNLDPTYGSYAGPVSFSVSGLPPGATATFSPSTVAANAGKQTITLTIQVPVAAALQSTPSLGRRLPPITLALLFLPFLAAGGMRKRGRKIGQMLSLLLLALGGTTLAAVLTGCGGHSRASSPPPETYTLTVTATSGNIQQSTTITLDVQ